MWDGSRSSSVGVSLSFCPSQHAFKIGKPRISSLHITSLTFSSKMYFIRSKVYIMAVYNVPLQIRQEICEMELPQQVLRRLNTQTDEQVWGKHRRLHNSLLYTAPGPWHCSNANTFCRKTTHTSARPANTSNVLRVPAQNWHNVSPTIIVTTQANTPDCCQQVAFK